MKCEWKRKEIGTVTVWEGSCLAQFLPPGPPKVVGYNFCPCCGREIEVVE